MVKTLPFVTVQATPLLLYRRAAPHINPLILMLYKLIKFITLFLGQKLAQDSANASGTIQGAFCDLKQKFCSVPFDRKPKSGEKGPDTKGSGLGGQRSAD